MKWTIYDIIELALHLLTYMKATPLTYHLVEQRAVFMVVAAFMTVISLLLSGCANRMTSVAQRGATEPQSNFITPTNFLRQIASTDCIIVSNRFSGKFPTNENLSIKLTRAQVKSVLKAISLLKLDPQQLGAGSASLWDLQLQFFHHKNLLGKANFQGAAIVIDMEYSDHTGTLEKIYDENYDSLLPSYMREKKQ